MSGRFWSLASRILNVAPSEIPHVSIAWVLGLLARICFLIGWTTLIVHFVTDYGIKSLPFLFVIHAFGVILGSFVFSGVVDRFKKEYLLIGLILSTSLVLFIAAFFAYEYTYLFLGLIFLALSIFHSQFKIIHSLFVEELFTPTQSNRVFPIIESSDVVGLIVGGALIAALAPVLPMNKFLYIWMLILLLAIPALIAYMKHSIAIPFVDLVSVNKKANSTSIRDVIKYSKKAKFVQTIVLIVFLQWTFFSVLEFQFTKAVEQSVAHTQEEALVLHEVNEFGKASAVIAKSGKEEKLVEEKVVAEPIHDADFEKDFATDLGSLQILFGSATLFFQLFLASRVLSYLGVVGSMLISPIVLMFSVIYMTFNFGFGSAILTRFNHELGHVLHSNAYHSSYYALSHHMRAGVKEFLEGFVRPIGSLFGTMLLFIATYLFTGTDSTLALNVVSVVILGVGFVATLSLKSRYEEMPKRELRESDSLNELINAVGIIRQNGKEEDADFLIQVHDSRPDLPLEVQEKIVYTIGKIGNYHAISYLMEVIEERLELRGETLKAINNIFSRNYDEIVAKPFTWYALKNLYQKLLTQTDDPKLRGELISFVILSNYHEGFVDQVIYLLDDNLDNETIAACSAVLRRIDDKHVVNFVKSFLEHEDPKVRSSMIHVVWDYLVSKDEVESTITSMLTSNSEKEIIEALILVAQLGESERFNEVVREVGYLYNDDLRIEFLVMANMCAIGYEDLFMKYVFEKIKFIDLEKISELVDRMDVKSVSRIFRRRVVSEIHSLYMNYNNFIDDKEALSNIQLALLNRLKRLYKIVGADKEYFTVEEILRSS